MGILGRFADIMTSNINAQLDKMEDPAKMVDQMLLNLRKDLAEVKTSTALVIAEETRTKRLVEENVENVTKYTNLAKKAVQADNDADATVFLEKKNAYVENGATLQETYNVAKANADKMRNMHNKLTNDISELDSRRANIKSKVAVANVQNKMNKISDVTSKSSSASDAFARMEEKANRALDSSIAMAELNAEPIDEAAALEKKYKITTASVSDELAAMKAELNK